MCCSSFFPVSCVCNDASVSVLSFLDCLVNVLKNTMKKRFDVYSPVYTSQTSCLVAK